MTCNIFFDEKKHRKALVFWPDALKLWIMKRMAWGRLVNGLERKGDIRFLEKIFSKNHCFYLFRIFI